MKTATGRKPDVAEGVRGKKGKKGKGLGDNQTIRQGEGMGRKKAPRGAKKGDRAEALELLKECDQRKLKLVSDGKWVKVDGQCPSDLLLRMSRCGDALGVLVREREAAKKLPEKTKRTERTQGTKKKTGEKKVEESVPVAQAVVEWTAEQMIEDDQQEYFCLKMAEGPYSQKSAYMQAYPDSSPDSARANASRLMTKDNIRRRIGYLKKELIKDVKLTVEESIRWCLLVRDTPVGYVDDESPLAQEVTRKEMQMGGAHGQLKRGDEDAGNEVETPAAVVIETRVKMPSKMDAQKQIDKLMGFDRDKEDPLEKAVDAMADMIRMIREKRGPETA